MTDPRRAAFLKRVRSALGNPVRNAEMNRSAFADPHPEVTAALQTGVRHRTSQERTALLDRLADAAVPLNIQFYRTPDQRAAADVIADIVDRRLPEWGEVKRVVAWDHPLLAALDLPGVLSDLDVPLFVTEPAPDGNRDTSRKAITDAFIGVTSAEWCVAATATLVARNHIGRPRSVSLVPAIHVAVIRAGQVVADFHELYALLNAELDEEGRGVTGAMTFISGPSKTADIEATLVHGAHGPRELHLIVIGG